MEICTFCNGWDLKIFKWEHTAGTQKKASCKKISCRSSPPLRQLQGQTHRICIFQHQINIRVPFLNIHTLSSLEFAEFSRSVLHGFVAWSCLCAHRHVCVLSCFCMYASVFISLCISSPFDVTCCAFCWIPVFCINEKGKKKVFGEINRCKVLGERARGQKTQSGVSMEALTSVSWWQMDGDSEVFVFFTNVLMKAGEWTYTFTASQHA